MRVRASLGQSGRALALVWQSAPAGVVVLAVLTVVSAALPPFVAYVGKLIVDAVMAAQGAAAPLREAAIGRAVRLVAVELAAVMAIAGTERALGLVRQVVGLRLGSTSTSASWKRRCGWSCATSRTGSSTTS